MRISEESAIADQDYPLLVKTFWDSNNMQREFCIKERYPNIGLFKHTLQPSDAFKDSPLSKDIANPASSVAVNIVDKTLGDIFRDPLFGATEPFKSLPSSIAILQAPEVGDTAASGQSDKEDGESGATADKGSSVTVRERSDSKRTVKAPLRLSAFGLETMELTVVG